MAKTIKGSVKLAIFKEIDVFEYNTVKGIEKFLHSFAGLYKLRELRKVAVECGEKLTPFIVMRHFFLDVQGKCWELSQDRLSKEEVAGLPPITDKIPETISYSLASVIPRSTIMCPCCNKEIHLDDYPTVVKEEERQATIELSAYSGLRLERMEEILEARTDGRFRMWAETPVRQVGTEKWELKTKDYIIQKGDECNLHCLRYYHGECSAKIKAENSRQEFQEIFEKAGYKNIQLEAMPNGYCSCVHCQPWQAVTTAIGQFVIGWRKRVINIEWIGKNYSELFVDEETTKWDSGIHAWGGDKATEYLKKILNSSQLKTVGAE